MPSMEGQTVMYIFDILKYKVVVKGTDFPLALFAHPSDAERYVFDHDDCYIVASTVENE